MNLFLDTGIAIARLLIVVQTITINVRQRHTGT